MSRGSPLITIPHRAADQHGSRFAEGSVPGVPRGSPSIIMRRGGRSCPPRLTEIVIYLQVFFKWPSIDLHRNMNIILLTCCNRGKCIKRKRTIITHPDKLRQSPVCGTLPFVSVYVPGAECRMQGHQAPSASALGCRQQSLPARYQHIDRDTQPSAAPGLDNPAPRQQRVCVII